MTRTFKCKSEGCTFAAVYVYINKRKYKRGVYTPSFAHCEKHAYYYESYYGLLGSIDVRITFEEFQTLEVLIQ